MKITEAIVFVFIFATAFRSSTSRQTYPDGYKPGNGYKYFYITKALTWQEGRQVCQNIGGDLAAAGVRNLTSRDMITLDLIVGDEVGWVGASDIEEEGVWKWVDGVTSTPEDEQWVPGEPDDFGSGEDCGLLIRPTNPRGSLSDRKCATNYTVLCEIKLNCFLY